MSSRRQPSQKRAAEILQRATVAVGKYSIRVDRTSPASKTAQVKRADQSARKDAQREGKGRHSEDTHPDSDEFDLFFFKLVCLRYGTRAVAGLGLASSTAPPRPKSTKRACSFCPRKRNVETTCRATCVLAIICTPSQYPPAPRPNPGDETKQCNAQRTDSGLTRGKKTYRAGDVATIAYEPVPVRSGLTFAKVRVR